MLGYWRRDGGLERDCCRLGMASEACGGERRELGVGGDEGVVRTLERRESGLLGRRGGGKRERWLRKQVVSDRAVADRVE